MTEQTSNLVKIKRWLFSLDGLRLLSYLSLIGFIITYNMLDDLPSPDNIHASLYQEPKQEFVQKDSYELIFKGHHDTILPIAEYEAWGLVVASGNLRAWYKFGVDNPDEKLNIRTIMLIYGDNVRVNDFTKVSFYNNDIKSGLNIPAGVTFGNEISNSRILSIDDAIRDKAEDLKIGDQIHIKGTLVNYAEEEWKGRMKETRRSRSDYSGKSEIILVDSIETIVASRNHLIAKLNDLLLLLTFGTFISHFVIRRFGTGYLND